jgi:hypothetical protein
MLKRGLRAIAPPPKGANAMTKEQYQTAQKKIRQLPQAAILHQALRFATLGGMRLAETFQITPNMLHAIPDQNLTDELRNQIGHDFQFVAIHTFNTSKTGRKDPHAIRMIDIVLLSRCEWTKLKSLMGQASEPIFGSKRKLISILGEMHLTGHSCKKGTAEALASLMQQGKIQEAVVPLMLKHKSAYDLTPTTTTTYMTNAGKWNVLMVKGAFTAAMHLRHHFCNDIPNLK